MNNYHHHYLPTSNNNILNIKLVNIDIEDPTSESPLDFLENVGEFLSDPEETDVEEEIKKSLAGASGRTVRLYCWLSIMYIVHPSFENHFKAEEALPG